MTQPSLLPFWNWDNPKGGMILPPIYADKNSPLYNPLRNSSHLPPTLVDLDYNNEDTKQSVGIIERNLITMYKQVVSLGKLPSLFMGSPYRAGNRPNTGAGSLEQKPHNTLHNWTGDITKPDGQDMGNFFTAGRDPIFFAHHANVDRMWNIWKTKVPDHVSQQTKEKYSRRRDFTDPDWLESSFLFYDENKNLVRVKVKDCLDTTRMGYAFQKVDIPWLNSRPKPKILVPQSSAPRLQPEKSVQPPSFILNSKTRIVVNRPRHSSPDAEEVLVIDIDCAGSEGGTKFDVIINDDGDDTIEPFHTQFAGSFVSLPHSPRSHDMEMLKAPLNIDCCPLRLGITELLEDLKAQNDENNCNPRMLPSILAPFVMLQNLAKETTMLKKCYVLHVEARPRGLADNKNLWCIGMLLQLPLVQDVTRKRKTSSMNVVAVWRLMGLAWVKPGSQELCWLGWLRDNLKKIEPLLPITLIMDNVEG
ncbi:hypothetical protein CR513_59800, partial [Mucuna pruriens]